ncbi:hypothetical protein Nepgr_002152 [Nepenthes gracilis]|uniref:Uncharacterized protein n=1 Tax=Nepenthes gracilis TaxID=150966 RepID=A0AAD3P6F7_NEPGR|nr:hypothetical protein Nepgr_002152 [Nepenthes gracilis]
MWQGRSAGILKNAALEITNMCLHEQKCSFLKRQAQDLTFLFVVRFVQSYAARRYRYVFRLTCSAALPVVCISSLTRAVETQKFSGDKQPAANEGKKCIHLEFSNQASGTVTEVLDATQSLQEGDNERRNGSRKEVQHIQKHHHDFNINTLEVNGILKYI